MKRLALLMVCVATLGLATSCSLLGGTSANSAAQLSGQTCGLAVQGLYSNYRSTGKLDLMSGNNLNNALALATAYTTLRQNKDNDAYRKAFTTGLIASSAGLITGANANAFVNQLLNSGSLAGLNAEKIQQSAAVASAIIQLLGVLK